MSQIGKPSLFTLNWDCKRQMFKWPSNLNAKMAMPDLQLYPWNIYQIINEEDIVVFLIWKVIISVSFSITSYKQEVRNTLSQRNCKWKQTFKNKNKKHWYLINTWSDKDFKGTVVNRALSSLHWGSLEITWNLLRSGTKEYEYGRMNPWFYIYFHPQQGLNFNKWQKNVKASHLLKM